MFRSIRVKLTLWYIGVLAIVFAGFALATYTLFVRVLQDESRTNMAEIANNFATSVTQLQNDGRREARGETLIGEALEDFQFRDYSFAVYSADNKLISKTLEADLPDDIAARVGTDKFARALIDGRPHAVMERSFLAAGKPYKLLVFYSLEDQMAIEARIRTILLIVAPLLLLLAGLVGYFLARKSLRPIAEMGERAKEIGAANLHERLPVANPNDEIGDLAVLFNQLLDRLDEGFEKQRRFMADASHELRTPLAIVRGESEVALQKEARTDDEYRESLRIVNDEGRRLSKIVEDLFTLARVDSGNIQAAFRELYIDEIVDDCVRKIRSLAETQNISVTFEGEELRVDGDEALLRRLFINLLDNAVKYNVQNGRVSVTAASGTVRIANTGPAIPDDEKDLIFERFYRVDKSISRSAETLTSGAGLGLSIAKWIGELHGASITLERTESGENIFSVFFER